ncbi:MAG TPA: ABC transporter permease, partial [Microvirga sp.]|nr:ABC transporter permease [Microvirga sp.]
AGAIYLALNFLVTRAVMALEWWLSPHLREARVAAPPLVEAAHV